MSVSGGDPMARGRALALTHRALAEGIDYICCCFVHLDS
jgi:hypothetical protein